MAGPVLSVAGSGAAQGQQAPAATPATPPALAKASDTPASATSTGKITLKEGADVSLKFAQDLSSKTAAEDNPVNLVLAEDLKIGDVVIAKSGAKAVGTITHMKKAGMMGESRRVEHASAIFVGRRHACEAARNQRQRGPRQSRNGGGTDGVVRSDRTDQNTTRTWISKEGTPLQAYTDEVTNCRQTCVNVGLISARGGRNKAQIVNADYDLAPTGAATSSCFAAATGSSTSFSQSQPSLMHARTFPILEFFSTIKWAPHLGQGSARG